MTASRETGAAAPQPAGAKDVSGTEPGFRRPRSSRAAVKDAAARAALAPLREGERPPSIKLAAGVGLAIALLDLCAYAADLKVGGSRPPPAGVFAHALAMLAIAVGIWRVRYWAVLAMEAMLALLIVIASLSALTATSLAALVATFGLIVAAGALFWLLVKAMARIQMAAHN